MKAKPFLAKPNIFLHRNYCQEDHFSVSLAYLLNAFPSELGNRFLNKIAAMSGYQSGYFGTFKQAIFSGFHLQFISSNSKPDIIIYTSKSTIYFENKLQARLSIRQLERHMTDVQADRGKLIFVSNIHSTISEEVIRNRRYIKPRNHNHFIWTDFESVFDIKLRGKSLGNKLLDDFKVGLRANGMKGRKIIGAEDNLYTNGSMAENIFLDRLAAILKKEGFEAWRKPNEFTLRVNVEKSGKDPLMNPRLYSSGEEYKKDWLKECMIIHSYCRMEDTEAIRAIKRLRNLTIKFREVDIEKLESDGFYGFHVYVPLKFMYNGNRCDINWEAQQKFWHQFYNILKKYSS